MYSIAKISSLNALPLRKFLLTKCQNVSFQIAGNLCLQLCASIYDDKVCSIPEVCIQVYDMLYLADILSPLGCLLSNFFCLTISAHRAAAKAIPSQGYNHLMWM